MRIPLETIDKEARLSQGLWLRYRLSGKGPPLLILNDPFSNKDSWDSLSARLEQSHTVLRFDLRGQGGSSPADRMLYDDYLDDALKLLNHLRFKKVHLQGLSASTKLCLDLYHKSPSRIASMVLCGPVFDIYGTKRWDIILNNILRLLKGPAPLEDLFDLLYPLVFSSHFINQAQAHGYHALKYRFVQSFSPQALIPNFQALRQGPQDLLTDRVHCPVALIGGEDDYFVNGRMLERLRSLFPKALARAIPLAGHYPHLENALAFEIAVADSLARSRTLDGRGA